MSPLRPAQPGLRLCTCVRSGRFGDIHAHIFFGQASTRMSRDDLKEDPRYLPRLCCLCYLSVTTHDRTRCHQCLSLGCLNYPAACITVAVIIVPSLSSRPRTSYVCASSGQFEILGRLCCVHVSHVSALIASCSIKHGRTTRRLCFVLGYFILSDFFVCGGLPVQLAVGFVGGCFLRVAGVANWRMVSDGTAVRRFFRSRQVSTSIPVLEGLGRSFAVAGSGGGSVSHALV